MRKKISVKHEDTNTQCEKIYLQDKAGKRIQDFKREREREKEEE